MKMKVFVAFVSMCVLSGPFAFGQGSLDVQLRISAARMAAANASTSATTTFPVRLGTTNDGKLMVVDSGDRNNEELFAEDASAPEGLRRIVSEAQLKAEIDEHNGGDPAPTALTIQAVDMDEDGEVIILTDGGDPEKGFLFSVNPATSAVKVLSGLDAPAGFSSIEGNRALVVVGQTAYITLDDRFLSVFGDAIVKISTEAPDGGTTAATELTTNAQLSDVVGSAVPDISLNGLTLNPKTGNLVAINSGRSDSNDDLLEIDIMTGAPSVLVRATDIEADIATSDVGYNGVGIDADGVIYLSNAFGPTGDATNRSILAIKNAGKGTGDASVFASQAAMIADPDVLALDNMPVPELRYQTSGLAVTGGGMNESGQAVPAVVSFCSTTRRTGATSDTPIGVLSVSRP